MLQGYIAPAVYPMEHLRSRKDNDMQIFVLTLVDDSGDSFTDYENRCPTDKEVHYCQDRDTAQRIIDDWHNEIRRSDEYKRFLRLELPTNDDPEPFTTYCDTYGIRESIEEVTVVSGTPGQDDD